MSWVHSAAPEVREWRNEPIIWMSCGNREVQLLGQIAGTKKDFVLGGIKIWLLTICPIFRMAKSCILTFSV